MTGGLVVKLNLLFENYDRPTEGPTDKKKIKEILSILSMPVIDFVKTGKSAFSKIWASLSAKSRILKTMGSLRNIPRYRNKNKTFYTCVWDLIRNSQLFLMCNRVVICRCQLDFLLCLPT